MKRPDTANALALLKGFQRDTVEYAFSRLFLEADTTHRFLVADEVGLGKTLVARGVIAKTIDHLWDSVGRIDVIYICSNTNIARQNINRLNLTGQSEFNLASRITLLPLVMNDLTKRRLNFISFTPGTSFQLSGGGGIVEERCLLYWLLYEAWDFRGAAGPKNVFQGNAGKDRFRDSLDRFSFSGEDGGLPFDADIAERFCEAIALRDQDLAGEKPSLRDSFQDLCSRFAWSKKYVPDEDRRDRDRLIGELRTLLAQTCLKLLQPDLIILDEFQRFRDLLDGTDPAAELARDLFSYADESTQVRVLLLSATPYKMYTLAHEQHEENHYKDFLRTIGFLHGTKEMGARLSELLSVYRTQLYALGSGGGAGISDTRRDIEAELKRVMARTERMRMSDAGDGMLREIPCSGVSLHVGDVRSFLALRKLGRELEQPEVVEYWKSSPYLLNFMDKYKLKESFEDACREDEGRELLPLLAECLSLFLPWEDLDHYREVDPGNARLRGFLADLFAHRTAELLWLPPTAPYYRLGEPFASAARGGITKRLVFSAWTVVPRMLASLGSYEAERRIFGSAEVGGIAERGERETRKALLKFTRSQGRLTGMPVLGLVYPSPQLARLGDPLSARAELGSEAELSAVLAVVRRRIGAALAPLLGGHAPDGPEDEHWYWAAPILLDRTSKSKAEREWILDEAVASGWAGTQEDEEESRGWESHVEMAQQAVLGRLQLGRPPGDLLDVLALLAVAGPANVALRSFVRVSGGSARIGDEAVRNAAGTLAWAFRSLFNQPEAMAILRSDAPDTVYWRRVLEYSAAGCIQAVVDEYAHLLRDFQGLFGEKGDELAQSLTNAMVPVISLRTSNLGLDEIRLAGGRVECVQRRLRARFVMRFGREKSEKSEKESEALREDLVRDAFNSPFWPFALATTSVGQEGLDFHPYCHAIVHWNLPANPVDLEQREGRIHRFKGHAIRKNVAASFAEQALAATEGDPWMRMFELAADACDGQGRGLKPYWIFPLEGGAFIERHVPSLPLSRDRSHLENLRKSLAVYRMVFGQPRQDDLLAYLMERIDPEVLAQKGNDLRISLAPPISGEGQLSGETDAS